MFWGLSWSWSYGSWNYNYLYNQCLSPLALWFRITLRRDVLDVTLCDKSLSVTCNRSVVFSGYSGFLPQLNWPPGYNWNIVESGIKHHIPTPNPSPSKFLKSLEIHNVHILFLLVVIYYIWYMTFSDVVVDSMCDWYWCIWNICIYYTLG